MKDDLSKKYCYDYPRPAVTVDIVLLRRSARRLEVLLIKRAREPFKGLFALPGGFIDPDESLEQAAARELCEETGLSEVTLRQLKAYSDPSRDPRGHTVSVAFLGKVRKDQRIEAGDDASAADWYSATRPPRLAFDHGQILKEALNAARRKGPQRTARTKKGGVRG
jgi:8-oxo-dGTP diphosphatase